MLRSPGAKCPPPPGEALLGVWVCTPLGNSHHLPHASGCASELPPMRYSHMSRELALEGAVMLLAQVL